MMGHCVSIAKDGSLVKYGEAPDIFEIFSLAPCAGPDGRALVFVCYLDDSDNDTGPIMGIGGYVALAEGWREFERAAPSLLGEFNVRTIHGVDFHHSRGDFSGWGRDTKLRFIDRLYAEFSKIGPLGVSTIVEKRYYSTLRARPGFRNLSPLGAAFASTVSKFVVTELRDVDPDGDIPLSIIVESGNRNSGNLVRYFNWLKGSQEYFGRRLATISFVNKRDCVAVQMADFLAYNIRRGSEKWPQQGYPNNPALTRALEQMGAHVRHRTNRIFDAQGRFDGVDPTDFPDDASVVFIPPKQL